MSPSRIQSAAGITTPPFRSPAFSTVSGFPFSPRSALLRPGPRRQGIGFASLRALDRFGPGRGAGSTTRKKGGSVASVAGGDHHGPLPVFGFSWNRPLSPGQGWDRRRILTAAAWLLIVGLTDWCFFVFCGFAMAILLGSSWFDRRGEFVANLWGTLQVGAIGLVALTPLLAAMIGQATEGIPEEHVSRIFSADLQSFFVPGPISTFSDWFKEWNLTWTGVPAELGTFIPWSVLLLAFWGRCRIDAPHRRWLALWVGVFFVLSLGPDWRQLEFPATTNRNPRFFRADPDHEDMVKDQQVRRLVKLRKNEKTLTMAAARAGLSRKTARKYLKSGKLPSQCQPERYWRTRSDPFESVWPEVEEILKRSPTVEATAVFEYLCRQQEGAFQQGQLRTLQRRIKQWKVEHGEAKEVMFPQKYRPGHQAQSDFTFMGRLGVTIQGQPFPHLLYHFVLAYSNWEATTLCFSESFESLSLGLQNALWELGALPEEHRTDRLSAAVNNLKREEFTERYQGLLNHFGMRSSRTQAGKAHENGDVEQAHHRLKRAIEQELLLRCSRDFSSREEYEGFVAVIVARRNAARQKRLGEELAVMRPLPARRLDDFTRQWVKVSPSSTIRVRHNTYSVDSRLIGERVQVRVWADQVEIYYGGRSHSRMPRLRGEGKHRIDYRHVIHSLVRKPGAFLRYRWREDLFPGILFRVAYDELRQDCPATADRQYLKILELAAQEGEQRVREALQGLIERGQRIRFEALRECLVDPVVEPWKVAVEKMDVGLYDTLLESREVRS